VAYGSSNSDSRLPLLPTSICGLLPSRPAGLDKPFMQVEERYGHNIPAARFRLHPQELTSGRTIRPLICHRLRDVRRSVSGR
jgi:hypothetical protein